MSEGQRLGIPHLGHDASVLDAAKLMVSERSSEVYVIDNDKLVGVVRYIDVVRSVAKGVNPIKATVQEIMLQPPPMVDEGATVEEVSKALARTEMRRIVVRSGRDVVGLLEAGELFDLVSASLQRVEVFKAVSVRARVRMAELLSVKSMSVDELAEELGIKPITVRHHIDVLRGSGIIEEVEPEKYGKVGRPISLFRATRSVLKRGALQSGVVTG